MRTKLLIGAVIASVGFVAVTIVRAERRLDYCAVACQDAETCGINVAKPCVANCEHGHREIELPKSCERLQRNIDKAGYLW